MSLKMKIKKGDQVIVIAGDDKGKTGEVVKAMPREGKVVVQGVNLGGIITKEAPINVSNVAIVDPKSGKASKIGYKEENGNKVRFARKSGEVIEKK